MQRKPDETLPDYIERWVAREFNARYVERVTSDLIDVAAGNREGTRWELDALRLLGAPIPEDDR